MYNDFGLWAVNPTWFSSACRMFESKSNLELAVNDPKHEVKNKIAVINLVGTITKGPSWFGGVDNVRARNLVNMVAQDNQIDAILLYIDSAGGHVAGTKALADAVKNANKIKPVIAYIDDLGASASYWIASQASQVISNDTAEIGSIGTVAVVYDDSEYYKQLGVKVHVVSSGDLKGAFTSGSEVTELMINDLQEKVDSLTDFFINAVAEGRNMKKEEVRKLATGKVWMASEAKKLNLIDKIQSFDDTLASLQSRLPRKKKMESIDQQLKAYSEQTVDKSLNIDKIEKK